MASRAATEGTKPRTGRTKRGQPTALTRPIPLHGEILPQGEAIAQLIRTGLPIREAARSLGLSHDAAYRCLGDGRVVAGLIHEGRLNRADLTEFQAAALDFYDVVDRAEAEALALHASVHAAIVRGGHVRQRTVIHYDDQGRETGRTVHQDVLPPDRQATEFWMERRRPDLFGRAERLELALGHDSPEVGTARPVDRLREHLADIRRRTEAGRAVLATVDLGDDDVHEEADTA